MMRPAGYLVNRPEGLRGERGLAYDYVLAGNGLFVCGERVARDGTPLIRATVRLAQASVRGLAPLEEGLALPQGPVPVGAWNAILREAFRGLPDERYLAVCWREGGYRLVIPGQEATPGSVRYQAAPNTVVDIHSHGSLGCFFSETDDRDDQGFRVSIVLGRLDTGRPEARARVSLYGHTGMVSLGQIFA